MRKSGILLHISSLPSRHGIGTFGRDAYKFVDFLEKSHQSYWQILPLGPTSYGDSPYQTFSAFANNPYFIDLDILVRKGLLLKEEIVSTFESETKVSYGNLYEERFIILRKAFERFNLKQLKYRRFVDANKYWLKDYAFFMALKMHHGGASWMSWDDSIRMRDKEAMAYYRKLLKDDILFYQFIQFMANDQWMKLKAYANKKGVEMIGDMPIYVSYDSSDVWANPAYFQLDEKRLPIEVAGVPPDNFSADGQLWGNPLYNWENLKKDGYSWWVDRVKASMEIFDMVRIDHFIGFQNYYSIPYGDLTARNGVWKKGPGFDLFKAINKKIEHANIIAEDLGVVTPEVRQLLKDTNFPGMKLLQFAFDHKIDSEFLPHHHTKNMVVYTGTHDNETTRTWFTHLNKEDRNFCLTYINHAGRKSEVDSLIKATLSSVADTAIIPMQDYLNLGSEGRMNVPSTTGNNWVWRMRRQDLNARLAKKIKTFTDLYGRSVKRQKTDI